MWRSRQLPSNCNLVTLPGQQCPGFLFGEVTTMIDNKLSNVTPITDALWARWKKLAAEEDRGIAALRANRLDQGRIAKELRDLYPSNIEFGAECNKRFPNLSHQRINDLIWFGSLTDGARDNLWNEFPEITNVTWLREKVRTMFGVDYGLPSAKALADEPSPPQPPQTTASEPKTDEPPENKPQNDRPAEIQPQNDRQITERIGFHDAPLAAELYAVFLPKTRTTLTKLWKSRGGKQAWDLIVTAYNAGLVVPNNLNAHEPTLALLFPTGPTGFMRQYQLDNHKQRGFIRDVLLPKMIICRGQLLAQPERIREILNAYDRMQAEKQRTEQLDKTREQALNTMLPGQEELTVYGVTVWPRLDVLHGSYDYDQIRTACWTFKDLLAWNLTTNDANPGSIGIKIRLSTKWYSEYLIRNNNRENPVRSIFGLIFWLSKLYENAPEAACKWPQYPHVECEWP
jgi:hypothetical protein